MSRMTSTGGHPSGAVPGSHERLGAFLLPEIRPNPPRVRAFLRTLAGFLLASFVVVTFKPTDPYWTVIYVLLVSVPTVGNSAHNAVDRLRASIIGCAAAVILIIVAFDEPWLFTTLQALFLGAALFIARETPVGPTALTGGATFVAITGGDLSLLPGALITLAFYRVLQAALGGGIGALAQLTFWPDDPLVVLKYSLERQIGEVEAHLGGARVVLDAARLRRHLELQHNAEVRHPELVHRRAELGALILEVASAIDETLRYARLHGGGAPPPGVLDEARAALRRFEQPTTPEPPPAPPPRMPWPNPMDETLRPIRRAVLKAALSAFIAIVVTRLLGYTPSSAAFAALTVSMEVSSGTAISKSLLVVGGTLLALVVVMLVVVPLMPNLEDPGSFLVMAALAFAPTTWLTVGGPRVRNAGLFGTVVVAAKLFQSFRPDVDLQAPTITALSISIGVLAVGVVDRAIWPVDPRFGMLRRAALMMTDTAALYRERDPRAVLADNGFERWRIHRELVALVQLRSEQAALPGAPWFAPQEEALRVAVTTQRLVVARLDEARRELASGAPVAGAEAARAAVAAQLDERAAQLEYRCECGELTV